MKKEIENTRQEWRNERREWQPNTTDWKSKLKKEIVNPNGWKRLRMTGTIKCKGLKNNKWRNKLRKRREWEWRLT
jgi:hypothetical protein